MQRAAYTEVLASEAYKSAGSGMRSGSSQLRSATSSGTSSSNERGRKHQSRESSDDSDDDDRKPHAPSDNDLDDYIAVNTEEGKLKVTYMRRRYGKREERNRPTGDTRPLHPTLQQPRSGYSRIDWSKPATSSFICTTPT